MKRTIFALALAAVLPMSAQAKELNYSFVELDYLNSSNGVTAGFSGQLPMEALALHPDAILTPLEPVTMLYHQPPEAGAALPISADTQAKDDASGIRMLKQHFVRLTPCTPLEPNASGLLVFTQDWRVSRKLIEDAAKIEQEYVVEVAGEIAPNGLKRLNHGLSFNGRALAPIKVSWQNETRLRFALKGVQPGQIRHMCESVGLQVVGMKRIRLGRVSMAKLLPGEWRYLMQDEKF